MVAGPEDRLTSKLMEIAIDLTLVAIRIVLIVAVAYALTRIARAALNRLESLLVRASEAKEKEFGAAAKRVKTLINVLWTISAGLIWFIAALVSSDKSASTWDLSSPAPASSASPSASARSIWCATWSAVSS
jgi:hypothetical protein